MPTIVKNLFLSKKFVVALLTAGAAVAMYFGWNVDPTKILVTIAPLLAYIGAQGWADSGKELAIIHQATALQQQQMAQDHEVKMATIRPGLNAASTPSDVTLLVKPAQAGFALLEVMLVLVILCVGVLSVVATRALVPVGLVVAAVAVISMIRTRARRRARAVGAVVTGLVVCLMSCSTPGQSTLHDVQCVVDNGVLGDVLNALSQADYVKAIEDLGLKDAAGLIDCALKSVASPQPGTGSGSGTVVAARTALPSAALAQRARDVLATRQAAGK